MKPEVEARELEVKAVEPEVEALEVKALELVVEAVDVGVKTLELGSVQPNTQMCAGLLEAYGTSAVAAIGVAAVHARLAPAVITVCVHRYSPSS